MRAILNQKLNKNGAERIRQTQVRSTKTSLDPSPRIGSLEYNEMMSKGVRPLAQKEPYRVARILTETAADMIRLRTHQAELNQGKDSSKILV